MIIFESVDQEHRDRCRWWSKMMVWCYFWLIFAEGILRKWVFPDLSAPLAVVRDPFLIIAMILAMRAHVFPWNNFTRSLTVIGIGSFCFGLLAPNCTLVVALNGFRTDFLHFYLVFLMPFVLTKRDVEQMARYSVWLIPLVAALMVVQFHSSPDAWINKTTGLSAEAKQLGGTVGNIRPPSIFTFISGVAEYVTMVSAFLLAALIGRIPMSIFARLFGTVGILVAIAVSISRYALGGSILVVLCFILFALVRPNLGYQLIMMAITGFLIIFVMIQLGFLEKSIDAFSERVTLATQNEGGYGGFASRITSNFVDPVTSWADQDLFGFGLGTLTNAGSLLIEGNLSHLQVENELSRLLLEGGLIMGPAFILWRVILGVYLTVLSFRLAIRTGDCLAWLLMPISVQLVVIGQLGRPTTLGFMAFTAGLALTIIEQQKESLAEA